ncbi:hypothetical protein ACWD04_17820 [Streptomyces sp. NPDC002911]
MRRPHARLEPARAGMMERKPWPAGPAAARTTATGPDLLRARLEGHRNN